MQKHDMHVICLQLLYNHYLYNLYNYRYKLNVVHTDLYRLVVSWHKYIPKINLTFYFLFRLYCLPMRLVVRRHSLSVGFYLQLGHIRPKNSLPVYIKRKRLGSTSVKMWRYQNIITVKSSSGTLRCSQDFSTYIKPDSSEIVKETGMPSEKPPTFGKQTDILSDTRPIGYAPS